MMKFRYDEWELKEKIKAMVRTYEIAHIDLTLVCYREGEDKDYLSFFLTENIMQGKHTTYKLDWISGYLQDTINLLPASSLCHDFKRYKIAVVKEWMMEKYGPGVKQTLRGKWYVNDKNENLECDLTEEEIEEEAYSRVYETAIKEIIEILKEYEMKQDDLKKKLESLIWGVKKNDGNYEYGRV